MIGSLRIQIKKSLTMIEVVIASSIMAVLFASVMFILGQSTQAFEGQALRMEGNRFGAQAAKPIVEAIREARVDYIARSALPSSEQLSNVEGQPPLWAVALPSARDNNGQFTVEGHLPRYVRVLVYAPRIASVAADGSNIYELVEYSAPVDSNSWSSSFSITTINSYDPANPGDANATIELSNGESIQRGGGRVVVHGLKRFFVYEPEPNGIVAVLIDVARGGGKREIIQSHKLFARPGS
ncbi:MAG: hypothetical protein P1V97_06250 [Planctomycetota bacterium]|nr:hypothetical protein [Planctomycetota bacterium]